jgi:uncharacterized protein (DUF433 family)
MIEIHNDPMPLKVWDDGSIRINGSRLLLYLVIEAWQDGATPEYIAKHLYPSLSIADAYTVIGYFLRHEEQLTECFRKQDEEAEKELDALKGTAEYQARRQKLLAFKAEWERQHSLPAN